MPSAKLSRQERPTLREWLATKFPRPAIFDLSAADSDSERLSL